jgi:hypothetical protein
MIAATNIRVQPFAVTYPAWPATDTTAQPRAISAPGKLPDATLVRRAANPIRSLRGRRPAAGVAASGKISRSTNSHILAGMQARFPDPRCGVGGHPDADVGHHRNPLSRAAGKGHRHQARVAPGRRSTDHVSGVFRLSSGPPRRPGDGHPPVREARIPVAKTRAGQRGGGLDRVSRHQNRPSTPSSQIAEIPPVSAATIRTDETSGFRIDVDDRRTTVPVS